MQCSTLEDFNVAGAMTSIPILKGSVTPLPRSWYIKIRWHLWKGSQVIKSNPRVSLGGGVKSVPAHCFPSLCLSTGPLHSRTTERRATSYTPVTQFYHLIDHPTPNFRDLFSAIYARRYLAKQCSRVTVAKATQSWASKYWPHPHMCSGTRLMWYYWWDTELQIVQV